MELQGTIPASFRKGPMSAWNGPIRGSVPTRYRLSLHKPINYKLHIANCASAKKKHLPKKVLKFIILLYAVDEFIKVLDHSFCCEVACCNKFKALV